MSSQNLGNQAINISYQQSFSSESYNARQNKINKEGIYEGGELTNSGTVLTIYPFISEFRTSAGQNVRVQTTANVTSDFSLPISESNPIVADPSSPFIVANYAWANVASNYVDFSAKASGTIYANDVIFGEVLFGSGSVITGFNYDKKTYGLKDTSNNVYANGLILRSDNTISSGLVSSGLVFTSVVEPSGIVGYFNQQKIHIPFNYA